MRIALYGNGSSGNHGCEAIVRGTYTLIKEPLTILSEEMDEDIIYGLAKFCNVLDAKNGKININEIDDKTISDYLFTSGMPNPDLLIRTGGECRISNYLLWQIAYAELHFANVLWPDFSKEEFCNIIFQYQSRERRFGKTSEQIKSKQ